MDCDAVLAAQVQCYGVAVSLASMPGFDFETDEDVAYTQLVGAPAGTFTSGSVFNIFRSNLSAARNAARGAMKIYAIPYIKLTDGTVLTAEEGDDWSLQDVMNYLDENLDSLDAEEQANAKSFYIRWAEVMGCWSLTNLQEAVAPETGKTA
jgi:hypothetical protein